MLVVKNLSANAGDVGSISGSRNPLEEGMVTHSSIFAWRNSWTEEPGGLQSTGSQRVRLNQSDLGCTDACTYLIDDVVLASGMQQSDSVITRDMSLYIYHIEIYLFFFRYFSIVGYYKILSIVPCTIQYVLVDYLFVYSGVRV